MKSSSNKPKTQSVRQKSLFSPENRLDPLAVDPTRAEPVLWIRRLAILRQASTDAEIRVIPFHRGLNIIRTEKRSPEDSHSVAHDVGKTLLMRLLRFTLGEEWFASREDTVRVRKALPYGVVIGEWVVAGELWSVVRHLNDRDSGASFAVRGHEWQLAVQAPDAERVPLKQFVERIESAALAELPSLFLKGVQVRWKDVLAWIARDCECGFRKTDTWRERAVNPKGAREPKVNRLIMQWLMGLMPDVEAAARGSREERRSVLKEAERQTVLKRERLQTLYDSLAKSAEFSPPQFDEASEPLSLSHCADELRAFVQGQATSAKLQLERYERESSDQMEVLRLQGVQLEDQRIAAAREAAELRTRLEILTTQQKDERKRERGPKQCPAKEECAWLIEIESNEAAGRMEAEELHLERLQEQVRDLRKKAAEAAAKEKRLAGQLGDSQKDHASKQTAAVAGVASLQKECGRWSSLASQVGELAEAIDEFSKAEDAKATICSEIRQDDDLVESGKSDGEYKERKRRLEDYYTHVLTHVFDDDAEGIIDIEEGLKPKTAASLHAHGTALSAMARVISFEISCLLGSMCGLGSHPRLLLHDGPREGEMEAELFRILFRTISWLESIGPESEAAFQYIITTADAPEQFSDQHPAVAETLHGRTDDGLLLKKRF